MTEKEYYILAGKRFKDLRELKGFTQSGLSEKTGIAQSMISKFENSGEKLSTFNMRKLLKAMDCSLDDLESGFEPTPEKKTPRISTSPFLPTIRLAS
jgi:transcriptional regulator with XRE-family HTH domain